MPELIEATNEFGARNRPVGILGGLGPLASAEFLKTIYEYCTSDTEQELPAVVMLSDPSFPDRSKAFLSGDEEPLLERLTESLVQLRDLGATKSVVCCVTLHHLLPRLRADLREHVWSLLDVIYADLSRSSERHLLLCTNGTRWMQMFQRHAGWEAAKDQLVLPDEDDQNWIHHELIYAIKKDADVQLKLPLVAGLLRKYELRSFVCGCTELHLLAKQLKSSSDDGLLCLDPLDTIARQIAAGLPIASQIPRLAFSA